VPSWLTVCGTAFAGFDQGRDSARAHRDPIDRLPLRRLRLRSPVTPAARAARRQAEVAASSPKPATQLKLRERKPGYDQDGPSHAQIGRSHAPRLPRSLSIAVAPVLRHRVGIDSGVHASRIRPQPEPAWTSLGLSLSDRTRAPFARRVTGSSGA
jgi:hypothetical protein